MMIRQVSIRALAWVLILVIAAPPAAIGQQEAAPVFKQEELDQILAPIALHPDSLVSQILIASTYPLEIVQADRFAQQNKNLKGDALTKSLEAQEWDPSVKSLVQFPQVLTMMSQKLDWTQKLGDAFLADQKKVLDTIQSLRAKAQAAGNLKTTKEQTVVVEQKIIKIEPASPEVVYVPTYNPTVVYGAWPYPAYPPYYYYPPGYVATSMFAFGAGVAMGAAWGYAWGNTNWGGGNVDYNYNQNTNINNNINRNKYASQRPAGDQGRWQHNAEHRKGVSYRDQGTAQKFNRASTSDALKSRESFRGRAETGGIGDRGGAGDRGGVGDRGAGVADRGGPGVGDRGGASKSGGVGDRGGAGDRGGVGDRGGASASQLGGGGNRGGSGSRGGAFEGVDRGGSSARSASQRGSASRGGGGGGGRGGGGGGGRGGGGGGGGRRR